MATKSVLDPVSEAWKEVEALWESASVFGRHLLFGRRREVLFKALHDFSEKFLNVLLMRKGVQYLKNKLDEKRSMVSISI